jgi:hypothetical protein
MPRSKPAAVQDTSRDHALDGRDGHADNNGRVHCISGCNMLMSAERDEAYPSGLAVRLRPQLSLLREGRSPPTLLHPPKADQLPSMDTDQHGEDK